MTSNILGNPRFLAPFYLPGSSPGPDGAHEHQIPRFSTKSTWIYTLFLPILPVPGGPKGPPFPADFHTTTPLRGGKFPLPSSRGKFPLPSSLKEGREKFPLPSSLERKVPPSLLPLRGKREVPSSSLLPLPSKSSSL